ncbi:hypothetical protein [Methylobacterium marchantiae]|uniref:Uncharacterized protein n=1 Tax=Methylobacterium marchantiae TaxID=600331 RepID=A0ABW3WXN8_9HYPH|nr:hypothetical protein AIGOOFII_2866 [Methylobacterium marchantiae]
MPKPVVPKVRLGAGGEPPHPNDGPTYLVVGASIMAAIGTGALAGLGAAVIAGIATLIVLGGLYTIAARLWGWPPLRWDAIPFIIP